MPRRDEINPFHGLSLVDMVAACLSVLHDVERPGARTRDDRADLANRVRYLLLAVIQVIDPQHYMQHSPENLLRLDRKKSVVDCYARWHQQQMGRAQSLVRSRTVSRAADWVMGERADAWLHPARAVFDECLGYKASVSEEGLLMVLRALDELHRANCDGPA